MKELKGLHAPKWRFYCSTTLFSLKPLFHWRSELLWKDKFGTPRVELEPWISFVWLWWEFNWRKDDDECEWWLWLHNYNQGNLRKALSSWPWRQLEPKDISQL